MPMPSSPQPTAHPPLLQTLHPHLISFPKRRRRAPTARKRKEWVVTATTSRTSLAVDMKARSTKEPGMAIKTLYLP